MKQIFLVVALAAIATPVLADGFSYSDLNTAARMTRPLPAMATAREQVAQTETVRAAFVLDPVRAWKSLSPDESHILYAAFGGQRPLGDEALQWFMRGASSGAGSSDVTGLYNPLADVWLVLRWQRIGGAPRIMDAAFVPGLMTRSSDDATAWTEKTGAYADALAQETALAKTGFASLDSGAFFRTVAPVRAVARERAFDAVMTWMVSLRPWGEEKVHLGQWQSLHGALASGKASGLVASLPLSVRASLLPMGAIQHDGGQALLLMSPLAPQLIVAADYGAGKKPDITLINLANARPATDTTGVSQ